MANAIAGIVCLVAWRVARWRGRWVWILTIVAEVLFLFDVVVGTALVAAYKFKPPGIHMFYGFLDATWQTYAYWLMGSLSNEPRKLAYFAGFYKSIQSAGAAVIWRVDALKHPFQAIFASSWGLCGAGLIVALPIVWYKITETNVREEDYITARELGMGSEKEDRAIHEA